MILPRSHHLPGQGGANVCLALLSRIVIFPTLETQPIIDMSITIDEDSEKQF